MTLARWDPRFAELSSLRRAMDRFFDDKSSRPLWSGFGDSDNIAVDMYQTDSDVVIKASLPGVKPDNIDLTITGDMLIIKGEMKSEQEVKEENYFRKEHKYGSFSKAITLPFNLRADDADASFDNGVLTITIPKSEEIKAKSIKVKAQQVLESKKE